MRGPVQHILLIEDDPYDTLLMERAVGELQIPISLHTVSSGEEAIEYFSGTGSYHDRDRFPLPGLVFMDIKLPRRSGFEVLAWMKEQHGLRRIPVLMLTSSREHDDLKRAYDLGANSYLVKPFKLTDLRDLVSVACNFWLQVNEAASLDSWPGVVGP